MADYQQYARCGSAPGTPAWPAVWSDAPPTRTLPGQTKLAVKATPIAMRLCTAGVRLRAAFSLIQQQ